MALSDRSFFERPNLTPIKGRLTPEYWTAGLARLDARSRSTSFRDPLRRGAPGRGLTSREPASVCPPPTPGLSYAPYRAATVQDAYVGLSITPGTVRGSVRLRRARRPGSRGGGGRRGSITELSERSRLRMLDYTRELGADGVSPSVMGTLTLPGEWESVAPDGRAMKRLLKAWRKRWERMLAQLGVTGHGALWFLEFQRRGAPHVHFLAWGDGLSEHVRTLRQWAGVAWAEVCAHSDPTEYAKHVRAGTQVSLLRHPDFRYAAKYAAKLEQKRVPESFADVGRFWGVWRWKMPRPVGLHLAVAWEEAASLVGTIAAALEEYAPRFAGNLRRRFAAAGMGLRTPFAFTAWGTSAVDAALRFAWSPDALPGPGLSPSPIGSG